MLLDGERYLLPLLAIASRGQFGICIRVRRPTADPYREAHR